MGQVTHSRAEAPILSVMSKIRKHEGSTRAPFPQAWSSKSPLPLPNGVSKREPGDHLWYLIFTFQLTWFGIITPGHIWGAPRAPRGAGRDTVNVGGRALWDGVAEQVQWQWVKLLDSSLHFFTVSTVWLAPSNVFCTTTDTLHSIFNHEPKQSALDSSMPT